MYTENNRYKCFLICIHLWIRKQATYVWNTLNSKHKGHADFGALFNQFKENPNNKRQAFPQLLMKKIEEIGIEEVRKSLKGKELLKDYEDNLQLKEQIMKIGTEIFGKKIGSEKRGNKLIIDCKKNPYLKPRTKTLVNICIALKFDKTETDNLFLSAGKALEPIDIVYEAYIFLLKNQGNPEFKELLAENRGNIIKTCDEILVEIGIEDKDLLGKYS